MTDMSVESPIEFQKEVEGLQFQLATVDLLTEDRTNSRFDYLEILLVKLQDIKVKMYQERGHQIPHIHIDYGLHCHVASYTINQTTRIVGNLDKKYDEIVVKWINTNKDNLLELWESLQTGEESEVLIGTLKGNA